jgi:hypothetical protein
MTADNELPEQPSLLDADPAAPEDCSGASVLYLAADPAGYTPALTGDGFAWLARVLPAPIALACPRCRHPMHLAHVPLLWQCTSCDPDT